MFSVALGTGLRHPEVAGLDISDVYSTTGQPKSRVRVRAQIASGAGPPMAASRCQQPRECCRPLRGWRVARFRPIVCNPNSLDR